MLRARSWLLAAFTCLLVLPICRADESLDALKEKGLAKAGNLLVVPEDKEVVDGMKNLRVLKKKVDDDNKTRLALEQKIKIAKANISQRDLQRRKILEQLARTNDPVMHNRIVAENKVLESQMDEWAQAKDAIEQKVNSLDGKTRQEFIDHVLDLSTKADHAQQQYKDLAVDEAVKSAIETTNQTAKPRLKLGPSPEFANATNLLKRWNKDVSSDTIPLQEENRVATVEVTLNGTLTRSMVLDSGASMVCLTSDLADELKLVPGESDPTIHLMLADGKTVEAKQMSLKTVRVGHFTVEDVEVAVLPKSLVAAEPLLGGTFLKNFIYKIDPKAHELHLAALAGSNKNVSTADAKKEAKNEKKPMRADKEK